MLLLLAFPAAGVEGGFRLISIGSLPTSYDNVQFAEDLLNESISVFESPETLPEMSGFVGKFKLVSQENFDDYMKAIGTVLVKILLPIDVLLHFFIICLFRCRYGDACSCKGRNSLR